MKETKKVWITKYWETQGILEKIVENTSFPDMVKEVTIKYPAIYHKPFWHDTKQDAIAHSNLLLDKKIKSVENKLKKLKSMRF